MSTSPGSGYVTRAEPAVAGREAPARSVPPVLFSLAQPETLAEGLRAVLPWWALMQAVGYSVVVLQRIFAASLFHAPRTAPLAGWDSAWYLYIAQHGYAARAPGGYGNYSVNGFFATAYPPLWPALIRAGSVVTDGHPLIAMQVLVAGFSLLAGVLLRRWCLHPATATLGGGPARADRARLAVALLYLTPPLGIWLFVGYTEALFLCLLLGAVLCAYRARWEWAGLLAAGAVLTKYVGLALVGALAVWWWQEHRRSGARLREGWFLGLPVAAFVGWQIELRHITGVWNAGSAALVENWDQRLVDPVRAVANNVGRLVVHRVSPVVSLPAGVGHHPVLQTAQEWPLFLREFLCLVAMVVVTLWLVRRGCWGLAALSGLMALILSSVSLYAALQRGLLVTFPVWLIAAVGWQRLQQRSTVLVRVTAVLGVVGWAAVLGSMGAGSFVG